MKEFHGVAYLIKCTQVLRYNTVPDDFGVPVHHVQHQVQYSTVQYTTVTDENIAFGIKVRKICHRMGSHASKLGLSEINKHFFYTKNTFLMPIRVRSFTFDRWLKMFIFIFLLKRKHMFSFWSGWKAEHVISYFCNTRPYFFHKIQEPKSNTNFWTQTFFTSIVHVSEKMSKNENVHEMGRHASKIDFYYTKMHIFRD